MKKYSKELNIQYLVALLKEHGIKRVIASPGTTNLSFVASLQCDSYFEIYSCVDERSAAYMAVGIAEETNEPVVITCTGATASRNYLSALTEAYYRKLPILAVTGTQRIDRIGQLHAQVIDRSQPPKDTCVKSVTLNPVNSTTDAKYCQLYINDALLSLKRHGGGPVHINLVTGYNRDFSTNTLPQVNKISRYAYSDVDMMPALLEGRICVFVGSHKTFTKEQTDIIDKFCSSNGAVVFCDHSSGYYGHYKVNFSLVAVQELFNTPLTTVDLCIQIGEVSGEYGMLERLRAKKLWRVSPDGEIRSSLGRPSSIFEMAEEDFFGYYTKNVDVVNDEYLNECKICYDMVLSKACNLPLSNVWIASILAPKLPLNSELHLGILNSLRAWNLFELPKSVKSFSNVGGFGIDGCMSSMIGASLIDSNKLYFGVFGDLAFFYDINSLGCRHVGKNLRILLINNGKGTEFRNFYHTGSLFGEDADNFIAAAHHFGDKSPELVKHYAQDLGFRYMSASTKEEFLDCCDEFLCEDLQSSYILEVFTTNEDESDALKYMWNLAENGSGSIKATVDHMIKAADKVGILPTIQSVLGPRCIKFFKNIMKI